MALTLESITIATPDTFCIVLNDTEITRGTIEDIDPPETVQKGAWVNTWADGNRGRVVGGFDGNGDATKRRTPDVDFDVTAADYLNRADAKNTANWSVSGGLTVTDVYYKANGKTWGRTDKYNATSGATLRQSMRHTIYLQVNSNLQSGNSYTITLPSSTGIANQVVAFDEKTTRCSTIRTSQIGYRCGASKIAYMSLWMPGAGTFGEVDLSSYGIDRFYIIDSDDEILWSGPITERISATEAQAEGPLDSSSYTGGASGKQILYQPYIEDWQLVSPGWSYTTGPNTLTFSYSGTNLSIGDTFFIEGAIPAPTISGDTITDGRVVFRVTAVDNGSSPKTVDVVLDVDGSVPDASGWAAWTSGGYLVPPVFTNDAGTYVYGLDFSDLKPKPGTYRILVDGFGVSDPFEITDDIYWKIAAHVAKGEYHLRSGCELDGRFGYSRDFAFKDGQNGCQIFKSLIPYNMTAETLIGISYRTSLGDLADSDVYLTDTQLTGFGGGVMDAGDWDTRINSVGIYLLMLLIVYREMTPGQRSSCKFGLPKSSEVLDADLYGAIDDEGDLLHSYIWNLDHLRTTQHADGYVYSGVNYEAPAGTYGGYGGAIGEYGESSDIFSGVIFAYEADIADNYLYAALSFYLAGTLKKLGYDALSTVWQTSAQNAYDWAVDMYNDTGSVRTNFYAAAKTAATTLGTGWPGGSLTGAQWDENITDILSAADDYNSFVLAARYDLLGEAADRTAYDADYTSGFNASADQVHGYIYAKATGATPANVTAITNAIKSWASSSADTEASADPMTYRRLTSSGGSWTFGRRSTGSENEFAAVVLAYFLDDTTAINRKNAEDQVSYLTGANQTGLCWINGAGIRNTKGYLHIDSWARGLDTPDGIICYGPSTWAINVAFNSNFLTNTESFGSFLQLRQSLSNVTEAQQARQLVEPHRYAWPPSEALWENFNAILHMEYTYQQSTMTNFWLLCFLQVMNDKEDAKRASAIAGLF